MRRLCTPARNDTTSELTVGNDRSGAPVIGPMSGGLVRNQGGTVEYITILCIPPLIMSGVGFFILAASENTYKKENYYG